MKFDDNSPTERAHSDEKWECWCNPVFAIMCDDCDADEVIAEVCESGEPHDALPGCWKCNGGIARELTRAEAEVFDGEVTIIHNLP